MLPDTALRLAAALPDRGDHAVYGGAQWSVADRALALSLIATWAARTGRFLPNVPVDQLAPGELIDFWADDQLDEATLGTPGQAVVPAQACGHPGSSAWPAVA